MTQIYAVLIALLVAAPAAAEVFAYKTDDGVFAYTNDISKVPTRYRAQVTTVGPAVGAERFTLVEPEASAASSRLGARLDGLRKANDADRAAIRENRAKVAAAAATKPPQTNIVVIQPRNERLGYPQRQRHHQE